MRLMRVLSVASGILLIVLGVSGVVFAQDDGCGLIIKRDPGTGNVYQFGCPAGPVCATRGGATNCTPGFRQDTYGNNWMVCTCVNWEGHYISGPAGRFWYDDFLCLESFLPHDPADPDGTGTGWCHKERCLHPCNGPDWLQDPEDPELERLYCDCY